MCISDLHEDDVILAKNFPMLAQFTLCIFMIDYSLILVLLWALQSKLSHTSLLVKSQISTEAQLFLKFIK